MGITRRQGTKAHIVSAMYHPRLLPTVRLLLSSVAVLRLVLLLLLLLALLRNRNLRTDALYWAARLRQKGGARYWGAQFWVQPMLRYVLCLMFHPLALMAQSRACSKQSFL